MDRQVQLPIQFLSHNESEVISHAKIQRIQVYSKPEPYRLGTVFPIKVTSTDNDGTFNGIFDFD